MALILRKTLMRRHILFLSVILTVAASLSGNAPALESKYHSAAELDEFLADLAQAHPDLLRLDSATKSIEGRDIWIVEIGRGEQVERATRPAMLVVAGLEGNHLVGTELVLAFLDHLTSLYPTDEKVKDLLDSATIYVFPRLNPDGAERYFMRPRGDQPRTVERADDDHDGFVDEDGPDDLNSDGLITWVRVEDSDGEHVPDEKDGRLMVAAKPEKGQRGAWRYFIEGWDNDADEKFNEDGPGGVNLNMNFPFGYKFFDPAAGVHQVCEPETRVLADFVVARQNIGLIFTFSMADNLTKTPEAGKRERRKPATKVNPDDLAYFKQLGKEYRETLGMEKELTGSDVPGSFVDWMYFHRGRMSLTARGWSPEMQVALAKAKEDEKSEEAEESPQDEEKETEQTADKREKPGRDKKDDEDDDKALEVQRGFLKWLDEHHPEGFVEWQEVEHPDFPGQKAEVGGFVPYLSTNPPPVLLEELGKKHAEFLTDLATKLPAIAFRKVDVTSLGDDTFEIEVEVETNGYLPTVSAHGVVTREVVPTRVELDIPADRILAGEKLTRLGPLSGSGGVEKVRYIVHADRRTRLTVRAVSALGGTIEQTMILGQ